jgi:propionyl-CoA carboxylase alpha chain
MHKVLIANRGEIAVRIIRTLKIMGIRTVAVYSEADRKALHVRMADEAYLLGPAPSSQSYLNTQKILEIARSAGCEGIHPGYGFLSENPVFADEVEKSGIEFIGPSSHAISVMGSKLAAKEAVKKYDIPMIPGTDEPIDDPERAIRIAEQIGFPVLIKASAGGGGKGMRIVENKKDLPEQMQRAISEARSAFGDGSVFIEKFITSPRHIEIQILADKHGNIIHLNERECSIQRRHQKVVEESPSIIVDEDLRARMGQAAIYVAKSCGYVGAGTVEFLVDENRQFYFLEMNTRLQVEHPVTEFITGLDLVAEQIRIARGEKLKYQQEDIGIRGHAIELRVYAEDPEEEFMPSTGKLDIYSEPSGHGIRVDSGFEQGMDVPIYYDPLLSKLITYGKTRMEAIDTMKKAIKNYRIAGVKSTLSFGCFVMNHPAFISGDFNTHFVGEYFSKEKYKEAITQESRVAAMLATRIHQKITKRVKEPKHDNGEWGVLRNF